jgi:hypothetical protein
VVILADHLGLDGLKDISKWGGCSGTGRGTEICNHFQREDRSNANYRRIFMGCRSIVINKKILKKFFLRSTLEAAASSV